MLTQVAIEEALTEEGRKLRSLVDKIKEAALAEAEAETTYKVAFARERMLARAGVGKITEAYADDSATLATSKERLAYLTAEATLMALREERGITTSRIDALRSLLSALRGVV